MEWGARGALGRCLPMHPILPLAVILAAALAVHGQPTNSAAVQPDSTGVVPMTMGELSMGICTTGAPLFAVAELTIAQSREAFLNGDLNCSSLVAAYLQRISAFDLRTQLNAVRALHPSVVSKAAELDVQLLAARMAAAPSNGSAPPPPPLPPLFCVPLLVKDNYDVQGLPTTAGSAGLLDNYPLADAGVITRLQRAGALVLGKTNMGELAFFPSFCISSAGGTVRNPYQLHRTTAGSSGGSAAGVAASFAMAGIGTDTGDSVRGPASHTALVGLRPSLGLVGRSGIVPLRLDRDAAGPLARSVADAAALLGAMAGVDPGDNMTTLLTNAAVPKDFNYTQFLDPGGLQGARIGVMGQIARLVGTQSEVKQLWLAALQDMRSAGAVLVDDWRIAGNSLGRDWDANRGGEGPALGHWNVGGRWEDLWACQAPLRVGLDVYLSAGNASRRVRSLQDLYSSQQYHPQVEDDMLSALQANYTPDTYPNASMRAKGRLCGCGPFWDDPCRSEFRQRLIDSMDASGVSAVVYPTWARAPLLVGDPGDGYYDGNNSPMISPHTGAPAITVPMGFVGGLPAGIQFLARPFGEPALLRLAYAYERLTRHRQPPPLFKECVNPPSPPPPPGPPQQRANPAGR